MSPDEFRKQIEALAAEYREALPARLAGIDAVWSELRDGSRRPERLAALQRELHSIAGSARTFGVAGVSEAAAAAEAHLEPFLPDGALPDAGQRDAFVHLLDALKDAAR